MTTPTTRLALFASTLLAASLPLSAQTVNWDGNGNADASGDWLTDANWAGDVAPSTTAITAGLVNVTSGTRTISINNGEAVTAKNLLFTQSTAGATNLLAIASGGTLTLAGGQAWAAPTAGTSRVELGGIIDFTGFLSSVTVNTDLTFTDAGAVFRASSSSTNAPFTFGGNVNVDAGAGVARIAYTGSTSSRTLSATFESALNINSGTLEIFTTVVSLNAVAASATTQGATHSAAGAELRLSTDSAGFGSSGTALANSGTLTQAGKITTNGRGNNAGATNTLTNSGAWKVDGLAAVIEKATNNNALDPTFVNTAIGVFSGASSADRIDFDHLQTAGTNLAFTNSGVIAAGDGTGGSGLASVGTLTLVDFAITNTATASFAFDLGGAGAGQFDVIILESGSLDFTDATLDIQLVNGFAPGASFDLDIFSTDAPGSVTGTLAGLTVNGVENSDYTFTYDNVTGVGTLSFAGTAIPEPSAFALLAGLATLGLTLARRRGSRAAA